MDILWNVRNVDRLSASCLHNPHARGLDQQVVISGFWFGLTPTRTPQRSANSVLLRGHPMPLPDGTVGAPCDSSDMTSDARSEAHLDQLDLPVLAMGDGTPPYLDDRGDSWIFGVCVAGHRLLCGWRDDEAQTFESFVDVETIAASLRQFMQMIQPPPEITPLLFKEHTFDRMECHDHEGSCCPDGCHDIQVGQYQHYYDVISGL